MLYPLIPSAFFFNHAERTQGNVEGLHPPCRYVAALTDRGLMTIMGVEFTMQI